MADIFDFNATADNALVGAEKSDAAMGFPNPNASAGLRVPSAELLRSRDRLNTAQAVLNSEPRPAPREPIVGYDPASGNVFSNGKTFNLTSNLEAITAFKQGLLDMDNSSTPMPANFRQTRASQIKNYIAKIPDWQKELQSGAKGYGANMALLGSAVTDSEGMKDTYLRMKGESDLLSSASSAPGSWDEVKFGENMMPYVRRLGLGSVPYVAEALLTGGLGGAVLKGGGTQLAKTTLENSIRHNAERIMAESVVGGIARKSEAEAVAEAARAIGSTMGRGAGVVAGTYPSAVGDVLSNQMEQAGKTDLGSAALYGVPYAGLNLLGLEGAAGGVGRALDRGLGATNIASRTGRAAAAAGTTIGGEALNEAGQEVANQAGRMAVDPLASLFSPEAQARYKEAAVGGALLGGVGGGLSAGRAAVTPAEARVTPQLRDSNAQANMARIQLDYDQQELAKERAIAPGGEMYQGPAAPVKQAQAATKTVADDPVALSVLGLKKLNNKQREVVGAVQAAGLQMDDPSLVDAVNLLAANKYKKASDELAKVIAARGAVPAGGNPAAAVGAVPDAVGRPDSDVPGGAPAGQPAPVEPNVGSAGTAGGAAAPDIQNTAVADDTGRPDFALTGYGPDEGPIQASPVELEPTPTNNLGVASEQQKLFQMPSGRRVVKGGKVLAAVAPERAVRVDEAAGQWDKIRGKLPSFDSLNPQQQAEVRNMHATGRLNKSELFKQQQQASVAEKQRVISERQKVEQRQVQERAERGDDGNEDTDTLRGVMERAFGIRDGGVLHAVMVMGNTYDQAAQGTKVDRSAVGKIVNPQVKADVAKGAPRGEVRISARNDQISKALGKGAISAKEAETLRKLFSRGTSAKARRDQAAELVSGTTSMVSADEAASKEADQAGADEASQRRAEENKGEDERSAATVYADDRGAITSEDLENNGMSIETGISNSDPDLNIRMSDAELAELRKTDPTQWASTITARALKLLDDVDTMQFKLAKVEASKRPAQAAKIESMQRKAADMQREVAEVLKSKKEAHVEKSRAQKHAQRNPAAMWAKFRAGVEDAPAHADLTPELKQEWADAIKSGASTAELQSDFESMVGDIEPDLKFRKGDKPKDTYGSAKELEDEILEMMRVKALPANIVISNEADLTGEDLENALDMPTASGWSDGKHVVIIADRILKGDGRAVFMHEVGGHLGLDNILGEDYISVLAGKILDMGLKNDNSPTVKLVRKAVQKARAAGTTDEDMSSEIVAYFIEEATLAGLKPADGVAFTWLRQIMAKFKAALTKFLDMPEAALTVQDIVDMAHGAAQTVIEEGFETDNQRTPRFSKTSVVAKLPQPLKNTSSDIGLTVRSAAKSALNHMTFTEDLISRATDAGVTKATAYREAQLRRAAKVGERERAANRVLEPFKALPQRQQALANDFIYDSTRENKWGFVPDWLAKVDLDQGMAQRFNQLDAGTQAFVKSIFRHSNTVLKDKQKLVRENVASELNADIEKAKAAKDAALADKLEKTRDSLLARFNTLFNLSGKSPYAPLRRTGDWLVVAKSPQYMAAEAAGNAADLNTLETDPDHYYVSFAESELAATKMARELKADGFPDEGIIFRPKEAALEELYGGNGMMGAFLKIKTQLEGLTDSVKTDEETKNMAKLQRVVTYMYLNALAEGSARKAELRRKGIAGAIDMIQGFSNQAIADSQFMASVEFNPQILKAISGMRKQAKEGENQADKMRLYNELMLRHVASTDVKENKLAERLTRITSLWMLATSPAYMLTNLTQTFVLSLPYISKQHGYTSGANAILSAYKDVGKLLDGTGVTGQIDFDKVPADARQAIKELVELGRIDIGLDSEMGSFKVQGDSTASRAWNSIDNNLRLAIQKIESINRLSAGIAAYRLELKRSGDHATAVAYASRVITQTHGDYSRANAPRVFNSGLGRVALQFRKFQLIQLTYLAKLMKDSFTGGDKVAARQALAYTLMHMGVLGGLVGMPGYAVLGAIASALAGDEGPDELEQQLRKKIDNQAISDLLLRGGPAALGVDLSGKLGMGTIMSILPFTDVNFTKRDSVQEIGFNLMAGATGGLALRGSDALRYTMQGDYYRGLESAMPSGIMNLMKAARFKAEGVTNPKGDVLVRSDETSLLDTFYQALGFTPTTTSRRQNLQSYNYDVTTYFKDRQAALRKQYVSSISSGRSAASVVEDWQSMQDAMRDRGLKPAPLGTLYKATSEQAKRERNTAGGVQFSRNNQSLVKTGADD